MKNTGLWGILVVVVMVGVGFARWGDPLERGPQPRQKLVLATSYAMMSGLVLIAHDRGFMADEGLDVTLNIHPSGFAALQAMLKNSAEISTVTEYPIVNAVLHGEKIRILGTIASSIRNNAVVARKDRGISVFDDLKGKKVGVTFGTNCEFLLETLRSLNHLAPGDIEKINVPAQEIVDAIVTGRVDAVCSFSFYKLAAQKQLGENHIVFYGGDIYTETFNLVATDDYIAKNPQVIEKVLRAMMRTSEFVREKPDMALDAMAKQARLGRGSLDELWHTYDYHLTMDQSLITTMGSQARWIIRGGMSAVKILPDFFEVLYLEGMKRVSPASITVIY